MYNPVSSLHIASIAVRDTAIANIAVTASVSQSKCIEIDIASIAAAAKSIGIVLRLGIGSALVQSEGRSL